MRRRPLVLALAAALAGLVLADVGASRLVVPRHWRPLPPFGALNTEAQRAWVARQRAELEGRAPRAGIGAFDAELGWSLVPGAASADGLYHVNSRGWRGIEPRPRVGGVRRVAAFGDSFTFCQEVPDDATWEARLDELRDDLEVLNLGVPGYGTDQALLRARRELPDLGADVVVVGLLLENAGRNVNRYRPLWYPEADTAAVKPRFVLEDDELRLVPSPYRTREALIDAVESGAVLDDVAEHEAWAGPGLPRWLAWSGIARILAGRRAYAARALPRVWADPDGEPHRVTVALLEAFRELADTTGAERFLVLVFPIREDFDRALSGGPRYWEGLHADLERRGLDALDVAALLTGAVEGEGVAPDELFAGSHLSPRANERVARALSERIPRE